MPLCILSYTYTYYLLVVGCFIGRYLRRVHGRTNSNRILLFPLQYCKNYLTSILESTKTLVKTNVDIPVGCMTNLLSLLRAICTVLVSELDAEVQKIE